MSTLLALTRGSDLLPECERWASNGKVSSSQSTLFPSRFRQETLVPCDGKPQIMWSICSKSCRKYSKDLHKQCFEWAKRGECSINPAYMQVHCPESCGFSLAWNPFHRGILGLQNLTLTNNILENLLQPCQIPNNLLNIADLYYDRLYLFLHGSSDILWSFHQLSPAEYYQVIGIVEVMTYIMKIFELTYISYGQMTEAKKVSGDVTLIQSTLLESLQSTLPEQQGLNTFSTIRNMMGGMNKEDSEDVTTIDDVAGFVDKTLLSIPHWESILNQHYNKIHDFYVTYHRLPVNLNEKQSDPWAAAPETNEKKKRDPRLLLSLNQCYRFENLELTKLLYYYMNECDSSNNYCIDSPSDFLPPRPDNNDPLTSKAYSTSSPTNSGNSMHDYEDESDLPILPDEFTSSNYPSYPTTMTLSPHHILSNGLVIPKLGFNIHHNTPLYEIPNLIIQAIEVGYRLIEINVDDPTIDVTIGSTLESIFQTGFIRRVEITIMIRFMNHSLPHYDEQSRSFTSIDDDSVDYKKKVQLYCKERLQRLKLDYIDAILLDSPPTASSAEIEIWEGLQQLYHERTVNIIGLANYDSFSIQRLLSNLPSSSSSAVFPMILYNKLDIYHYGTLVSPLFSTIQEWNDILILIQDNNMILMGYSPFSGYPYLLKPLNDPAIQYIANRHTIFSSNYTSTMNREKRFHSEQSPSRSPSKAASTTEAFVRPPKAVDDQSETKWDAFVSSDGRSESSKGRSRSGAIPKNQITEVAKDSIITPAQILLRYFLEQNIGMIIHSTSLDHLKENYRVFEMLPLSNYERLLIESLQYIVGNYQYLSR